MLVAAVCWLMFAAGAANACTYARGAFLKTLDTWKTTCGHPLCGQIQAADPSRVKKSPTPCDAETWLTLKDDMVATVAQGGTVLVGEVHDNPKHHDLQAILGLSSYPAIVLEQISQDQAPALEAFMGKLKGANITDALVGEFKTAIGWEKSGWAKYNYDPVLRGVLFAQRPVYAGDVAHDAIKKVASEGESALPVDVRSKLNLDTGLGGKLDAASAAEIEEAHCGMLPKTAIPNMGLAQRYRDAHLANVAFDALAKHGSVLVFAGNNHVRTDRGVPWYLRARAPDKKILSLMLIEVEDGKTDPAAYVPKDPDGKPAADYIIFTPRATRGDPCEGMKKKAE